MRQHWNHNDEWPQVRRFGLEVDPDTGALTLRKLPGPPTRIGGVPGDAAAAPTAAGLAVGTDGTVYVSDPTAGLVLRLDPLADAATALGCVCAAGPGSEVGQLRNPQGLAYQSCRNRLLIADTGNRRIQVVDPIQERVVAVWGQTWPYQGPRPCGGEGGLDGPEQLACDRAGNAYVVDRNFVIHPDTKVVTRGKGRLVKLDRDGVPVAVFLPAAPWYSADDTLHVAVGTVKGKDGDNRRETCADGDARLDRVFVLAVGTPKDRAANPELRLFVFDTDGQPVTKEPLTLLGPDLPAQKQSRSEQPISTVAYLFESKPVPPAGQPARPMVHAFAVIGDTAVVSLPSTPPRVWCFQIGDAVAHDDPTAVEPSWLPLYDGPAVALGVRGSPTHPGRTADLLLFAGPGRDLYALTHRGAYRTQGAFLAGPFTGNRDLVTRWHRLRFDGRTGDAGRTQWFTLSRSGRDGLAGPPRPSPRLFPSWYRFETQPDVFERLRFSARAEAEAEAEPGPNEFDPIRRPGTLTPQSDPSRTPPGVWTGMPENQFDALVRNSGGDSKVPADQLWVLGLIAGDGRTSPSFFQVALEHDEDGWLAQLPEVYQRQPTSRAFMRALLALLQSRFADVSEAIDVLPALFSPHAVTARYGRRSPELDWLRAALAMPTAPRLGDAKADRERNVQTFADGTYWLARRGTAEGLRRLVWLATGVELVIEEPGAHEPADVFGHPHTGLPAAAEGGSQGSENVLGYSTFPDPDDARPRLPDDLAHHFVARGYEVDLLDDEVRGLVERVVATLAPAHCTYSVQVIEPRARVGVQARLSIDAVVAPCHPAEPMALDRPPGPDAQIDPTPLPPTVGTAHLGRHTPLM